MADVSISAILVYVLLGLIFGSFILYAAVYIMARAYYQARLLYDAESVAMHVSLYKHELTNKLEELCNGKQQN